MATIHFLRNHPHQDGDVYLVCYEWYVGASRKHHVSGNYGSQKAAIRAVLELQDELDAGRLCDCINAALYLLDRETGAVDRLIGANEID